MLNYFASLDIPVMELFGQSESTGPHTSNFTFAWKVGTIGRDVRITKHTQRHQGGSIGRGRAEGRKLSSPDRHCGGVCAVSCAEPFLCAVLCVWQLPGVKTKQIPVDKSSEGGQAEFCMYGRHVMMGYLKSRVRTTHTVHWHKTHTHWHHKTQAGRQTRRSHCEELGSG